MVYLPNLFHRLRVVLRDTARETWLVMRLSLACAVASALPARLAIASEQGSNLMWRGLYLLGGMVCDVAEAFPFFGLLAWLLFSAGRRSRRVRVLVGSSIALATVALWFGHNAATLFRLERGYLPALDDVHQGMAHSDFAKAHLTTLVAGEFTRGNLLAVVTLGIATVWVRRELGTLRPRQTSPWRAFGMIAFGTLVAGALLEVASLRLRRFADGLHNQDALSSPLQHVLPTLASAREPAAPRVIVRESRGSDAEVIRGAALYGFDVSQAGAVLGRDKVPQNACNVHPLRSSLDAPPPAGGWAQAFLALSRALFPEGAPSPVVFHVSFESMRADDIHAIHPAAPAELTPFLNGVFAGREPRAAPLRHVYQSGVRTAHAVSAALCGVGPLPMHVAFGRDLGKVPMRCAPDVLGAAGFKLTAYYGHEFVFDDMATFLGFHGFTLWGRPQFASAAPRGVWGAVTDRAVYAAALQEAVAESHAQYNFILTLSHHTPYPTPSDAAPADVQAMQALCRERDLSGENCDRLITARYADAALAEFFASLEQSPLAPRALVIVAADHTTHVREPWASEQDRADATSQIPAFVWVPRAAERAEADRLAEAMRALETYGAGHALSNADLPRAVLALLSESAPVRALPASSRWHTLPGASMSPAYRALAQDEVLWGIDAHAELFGVRQDPSVHAVRKQQFIHPAQKPEEMAAEMRASLAFWGAFLRGSANCPRQ